MSCQHERVYAHESGHLGGSYQVVCEDCGAVGPEGVTVDDAYAGFTVRYPTLSEMFEEVEREEE